MEKLLDLDHVGQIADTIGQRGYIHSAEHSVVNNVHQLVCNPSAKWISFQMSANYANLNREWTLNGKIVKLRYRDGSIVSPGTLVTGDVLMGSISGDEIRLNVDPPSVNPNQIVNSDFSHPINTEGKTEYTQAGYCLDDWWLRCDSPEHPPILSIVDGGIHLHADAADNQAFALNQWLEHGMEWAGQIMCMSVLIKENNMTSDIEWGISRVNNIRYNSSRPMCLRMIIPAGQTGLFNSYFTLDPGTDYRYLSFSPVGYTQETVDTTLVACKLEFGKRQTLAHLDESGNWVLNKPLESRQEEERRCMRYQYGVGTETKSVMGVGWAYSASTTDIFIPLPVPMVEPVKPYVIGTLQITSYNTPTIQYTNSDVASVETTSYNAPGMAGVIATRAAGETDLVPGDPYILRRYKADDNLILRGSIPGLP